MLTAVRNRVESKKKIKFGKVKAKQIAKIPGLRIRIHFIQIRIQHFRLNTNPDPVPIRIQGSNDQKLKKDYN
jgi:hypothetical protein